MNKPNEGKAAIKHINSDYDKEIVLVSDFSVFDLKKAPLYDAVILDFTDKKGCLETLRIIRSSFIESIYLLPVFILSIVELKDEEIKELSDGIINNIQTDAINSFVENVKIKRKQLKPFTPSPEIDKNLIKLLRFSFTRDKSLRPVKDRFSVIGYKYPLINLSVDSKDAGAEMKAITTAVEESFFRANFIDRMHLCGKCYSGFMNFKEVDPETGDAHLETENIIHHFSCAYVGPESDFTREDKLICPKCSKTLRHIGVDYDKPSVMYHSIESDRYFQEPEMKAECLNCGHVNDIEGLVQYDLYELTLTDEGKDEAIQPTGSQTAADTVYSGYITYATFGTFLRYEIERVKASQKNSSIGLLRPAITSDIENDLGHQYQKLIEEISAFVVNNTTASNILSRSVNSFFILMPEMPVDKCNLAMEKMKKSLKTLLENNVKEHKIEVHSSVREITPNSEYQSVLNDLRAGILKD